MDEKQKGQAAIDSLDAKALCHVSVSDRIILRASARVKVEFTVTGIKKGPRGYAISLRTDGGLEWVVTPVRWEPPS